MLNVHPHNRPHTIDSRHKKFFYSIYKTLFHESDLLLRVKYITLESVIVNLYPLKIVSISEAALLHLHEHRNSEDLRRGHALQRKKRGEMLFESGRLWPMGEMIDFYAETDTVALIKKEQNAKHDTERWGKLFAVPAGFFENGSFALRLTPRDLGWVDRQMAALR